MASLNSSPCLNCPNVGCGAFHGKCEKYLLFTTSQQLIKKQKIKEQLLVNVARPYYKDYKYDNSTVRAYIEC